MLGHVIWGDRRTNCNIRRHHVVQCISVLLRCSDTFPWQQEDASSCWRWKQWNFLTWGKSQLINTSKKMFPLIKFPTNEKIPWMLRLKWRIIFHFWEGFLIPDDLVRNFGISDMIDVEVVLATSVLSNFYWSAKGNSDRFYLSFNFYACTDCNL